MFFRIFKVAGLMTLRLVTFTWRRLIHAQNQDGILDRDFLAWAKYFLRVFDVELSIIGREHIPGFNLTPGVAPNSLEPSQGAKRKIVIMSNHQSELDIPALVTAFNRGVGFVAKRELGRIPVLGFFMGKVGCVFIDRSDSRSAHKVLEKAAQEMGSTPLVVFPEGTRSKDGSFLPLKQGGFRMAILADAIVLPVLIQNTRNAGENRAPKGPLPIPVSLRVFPAMDTRDLEEGKIGVNTLKDYVEKCWRSPNEPI